MPKRKTRKLETINELVEEIKNAESEVESAVNEINSKADIKPATIEATKKDIIDCKRSELIRLSEDGEIDQSVAYLRNASEKIVVKLHKQMEDKQLEKANMFLTDLLISKFSCLLGVLEAIESETELDAELQTIKM